MEHYALVGDPVAHSLSPKIYHALFEKYNVDACFDAVCIKKGVLDTEKLRALSGFACTMPHKEDIIGFLDGISDEARVMHSVNIVKNDGGRLFGYSTDGGGLMNAMAQAGYEAPARVVIIGSGGAARSAAYAALARGALVTLAARNASARESIARELRVCAAPLEALESLARTCDVIINATPQGMTGHEEFQSLDFLDALARGALAVDMVYFPHETRFLSRAAMSGANVLHGEEMLVHQALLAFRIWTGIDAKRSDVPPLFD